MRRKTNGCTCTMKSFHYHGMEDQLQPVAQVTANKHDYCTCHLRNKYF